MPELIHGPGVEATPVAKIPVAPGNSDLCFQRLPRARGRPRGRRGHDQFLGGMVMGISMALHEEGVLDREFGDYLNHDFAQYHVASIADVRDLEAHWIDEHDDQLNPLGAKGIGEIGIVGAAAAVGNAIHHTTGTRVRALPITPDKLLQV